MELALLLRYSKWEQNGIYIQLVIFHILYMLVVLPILGNLSKSGHTILCPEVAITKDQVALSLTMLKKLILAFIVCS